MPDHNYPTEPGWTGDHGTSEAAAKKVSTRAPSLRRRVWDYLETCGYTGEELASIMQENLYSVLPRITEMQHDGMVRDSGQRGKTKLGGETVIWERVPGAVYHDRVALKAKPRRKVAIKLMVDALKLYDATYASTQTTPTPVQEAAVIQAVRKALDEARAAGLA